MTDFLSVLRQAAGYMLLVAALGVFVFYVFQSVRLGFTKMYESRHHVREARLPLRYAILVFCAGLLAIGGLLLLAPEWSPLVPSLFYIALFAGFLVWLNMRLRLWMSEKFGRPRDARTANETD